MNTKCLDMTKKINLDQIKEASDAINRGSLVAFPTETVYGLGANALDEEAVKSIFIAKGRPQDNPLIVHISDIKQLGLIAKEVPENAKKLMDKFWPGPLTILFKRSKNISDSVTAGLETVGVRMPSNKIALSLINEAGVPIAAPSANVSGKPSPTKAWHVLSDFNGKIDYIIDGGQTGYGLESTVVDVIDSPMVLRPGGITLEMLKEVDDRFIMDPALDKNVKKAKSPGQKYRHYAPNADVEVYVLEGEKLRERINERIKNINKKDIGLMLTSENVDFFKEYEIIDLGDKNKPEMAAEQLFEGFRVLDKKNVSLIIVEGFIEKHMGLAVMNRLKKAAQGKVFFE